MLTLDQVKDALRDRNLSKVAAAIGCSRATLSGYLLDKFKPSAEMLEKLSTYIEGGTK